MFIHDLSLFLNPDLQSVAKIVKMHVFLLKIFYIAAIWVFKNMKSSVL